LGKSAWFPPEYQYEIFLLWYNNGRPSSRKLHAMIPEAQQQGVKPSRETLSVWIRTNFEPQAEKMLDQISKEMEARTVKEKVEMLKRHVEVGVEMQNTGMDYIEENKDQITPSTAVRLVIEGVRIERESRGVPQALQQMIDQSDEDLAEEIIGLIGESQVEILEE
jgi:hypothetical protein